MKRIALLSVSLLAGVVAGSASAQEIQNLVHVSAANQSANAGVTRAIAEYIAARNNATVVQAMARARPDKAPTMTVEALLAAIESNARIVEPVQPAPAAVVAPPPEAPPAPAKKKNVRKGSTGGSGGGASGGGGGGW